MIGAICAALGNPYLFQWNYQTWVDVPQTSLIIFIHCPAVVRLELISRLTGWNITERRLAVKAPQSDELHQRVKCSPEKDVEPDGAGQERDDKN